MEQTQNTTHKKLYRSQTERVFAGICGGLSEYFDMDVTLIRLIWLLVVIFTGIFPGVIVYIIAIFIIPNKNEVYKTDTSKADTHTVDSSKGDSQ